MTYSASALSSQPPLYDQVKSSRSCSCRFSKGSIRHLRIYLLNMSWHSDLRWVALPCVRRYISSRLKAWFSKYTAKVLSSANPKHIKTSVSYKASQKRCLLMGIRSSMKCCLFSLSLHWSKWHLSSNCQCKAKSLFYGCTWAIFRSTASSCKDCDFTCAETTSCCTALCTDRGAYSAWKSIGSPWSGECAQLVATTTGHCCTCQNCRKRNGCGNTTYSNRWLGVCKTCYADCSVSFAGRISCWRLAVASWICINHRTLKTGCTWADLDWYIEWWLLAGAHCNGTKSRADSVTTCFWRIGAKF